MLYDLGGVHPLKFRVHSHKAAILIKWDKLVRLTGHPEPTRLWDCSFLFSFFLFYNGFYAYVSDVAHFDGYIY